jgi:hypothetical protein
MISKIAPDKSPDEKSNMSKGRRSTKGGKRNVSGAGAGGML